MKKTMVLFSILLALLLSLLSVVSRAAVPSTFAVQGVLRDGSGNLQSTMVSVTASLWDAQSSGNKLAGAYGPTGVMATNGLFTLPIDDAALQQKLAGASQVWLEVTVGSDTFARQPVTSQLFAQMCGSAERFAGSVLEVDEHTSDINPAYLVLQKSRGSASSPAPIAGGDILGQVNGGGYTGAGYDTGGAIRFRATENFTPTHNGTAIDFFTTPNGAVGPAEQSASIDQSGLRVKGGITIGSYMSIDQPAGQELISTYRHDGITRFTTYVESDGGRFSVGRYDDGGNWIDSPLNVTRSNGNVGIGTGNPQSKLEVAGGGELRVTDATGTRWGRIVHTSNGNMHIDSVGGGDIFLNWFGGTDGTVIGNGSQNYGHVYASAFVPVSDARLKTHVRTLEHALDHIERLRGVRFDWKSDGTASVGVIAQEVEQVFPELVHVTPEHHKAVEYDKLVGALIEATKELNHKNAALEARVRQLETRLNARN